MYKTIIRGRQLALSALICAAPFTTAGVQAQTPAPPGLFSVLPAHVPVELPENAIAGRANAVTINHGRLRSGRFFVSLPDGISFEAVRDSEQNLGNGRFAWVGRAGGSPGSRVILGVSGDSVSGTFAYRDRLFKLEPRADGTHVISEVGRGEPAPELDPVPVADTTGTTTDASGATVAADTGPVIDVLVAYTPYVKNVYGASGADALAIQAVAEANQAYANSGITARLNLVHTALTNYTESGDMGTDLSRLRGNGDGYMDELHALRDTHGADMVSLIEHEPQYCGIAYRMTSLSSSFASAAFSVVHRTCATGYYSFAHELGHNQGAHHDHANASGGIYPYAYGYQEPLAAFRTVMAYNCQGGCTRVDHFSNPDVLLNAEPTGVADYADNARTINQTAATVAAFRQQVSQVPPAAPSGLEALAASSSAIDLSWVDNAADESGFTLERASDGISFAEIATLAANTTGFRDDNLQADTLYTYRVRAWNSAGTSAYTDAAVAATLPLPPLTEQRASGEVAVGGSVSGTYQDTWEADDLYQIIRETESAGRKRDRHGFLEHKWTFQVQPGDAVTLSAIVRTGATAESFVFAYSSDDRNYVDMFTVDANSPAAQDFYLPSSLSGTVYVRVRDMVAIPGDVTAYAVEVDQLLVRTENGSGAPPPPPEEQSESVISLGANGYKVKGLQTVDLSWSGAQGAVDIYRDGARIATAVSGGAWVDDIGLKGGGSYSYEACESDTTSCSNIVGVVF